MKKLFKVVAVAAAVFFAVDLAIADENLVDRLGRWGQTAGEVAGVATLRAKNLALVAQMCTELGDETFPYGTPYCEALSSGVYRNLVDALERVGYAPLQREWMLSYGITGDAFMAAKVEDALVNVLKNGEQNQVMQLEDLANRTAHFLLSVSDKTVHDDARAYFQLFPDTAAKNL